MRDYRIQSKPLLPGTIALLQSAQLPTSDLTAAHMEQFFYSGSDAQPDGMIGLEL